MLNPISLIHFLCASINSPQFSSPRSTMHASRTFFVSGQAQHGLNFFFSSSLGFSSSGAATEALIAFPDIGLELEYLLNVKMEQGNILIYYRKIMKDFVKSVPRALGYFIAKTRRQENSCHACSNIARISIQDGGWFSLCFLADKNNVTLNRQV